MKDLDHPLRHALRNLRHLYEQMLDGSVKDQVSAANGLLSPAIGMIETHLDKPTTCLTCGGRCFSSDDGECYACFDARQT